MPGSEGKYEKLRKLKSVGGASIIPADGSIEISSLSKIFSGKKIDPKQLRKTAWQRSK